MRWFLCVFLWAFLGCSLCAQDVIRAALYLSGAATEEEIPEDYISFVESSPKVRINAKRIRPGLLSDYQIASLTDYRASHGDILSLEELALVDGFSAEAVAALGPFLSLESSRMAGNTDTLRVRSTVLLRGTLTSFGAKAKVLGDGWRAGGAWRSGGGSFYGEYSGRFGTLLAGDFNIRYGQGLISWSGFSLSSLSTVDAFVWKATGLSPVWSYATPQNRGIAYEYGTRDFRGAVFATLSGTFGAHADYLWRHGQAGGTVILTDAKMLSFSLDGRYNFRGSDVAWEAAYRNRSVAGKAALRIPVGESFRLAVQGRGIPSHFSGKKYGEYGAALGTAFTSGKWQPLSGKTGFGSSVPAHQASLTVDASMLPIPETDPRRLQIRVYASWKWQMLSAWALELRLTERYRNYENPRMAFRADVRYGNGPWLSVLRTEVVRCDKTGFLGYWEGGYKADAFSAYLRLAGFLVDQWNDRIYCYERDAPGTFSVPAYYGRGGALSAVGSWKHRFLRRFQLRIYGRAALMMRRGRELSPTLNLQLHAEF